MRRSLFLAVFCVCVSLCSLPSASAKGKSLQIFSVDTEGGQSTLVVTPAGQSILFDAGFPGFHGAHADRIMEVAKKAGIKQIDYLIVTHYHRDHVGGVPELAKRIKIVTFVDHGPNREDSDITRMDYPVYEKLFSQAKHLIAKPGETLPLEGVTAQFVTADGQHITSPLPGAGQPNPNCASEPAVKPDDGENGRSVGTIITYGKFRFADFGDLTKDREIELMCPNNMVGTVDLFLVSHHGRAQSNSKALVWALHPRVAIMDNGARKFAEAPAWENVHSSPGLEDFWQIHLATLVDKDHNVPDQFIANLKPDAEDENHYIMVSAEADGTFTVTNTRNNFSKTYKK